MLWGPAYAKKSSFCLERHIICHKKSPDQVCNRKRFSILYFTQESVNKSYCFTPVQSKAKIFFAL